MIRINYCPKCNKITNQKTTKTLKSAVTVCEVCQTTLKTEYKSQKPLHRVLDKMSKQRREEKKLTAQLVIASGGLCEICHRKGVFGLAKHEIVRRGQQGDECSPLNTLLLCTGGCHNHVRYPKTGTPLSIEEQLALAKKLHIMGKTGCR